MLVCAVCGLPGCPVWAVWAVLAVRLGLCRILGTGLLPRLAFAGLGLRLARMRLRSVCRVRMRGTGVYRPPASASGCRILRGGKGIVAVRHEQAGKPPALPERTDRVYERKSHEHSSQATSALL